MLNLKDKLKFMMYMRGDKKSPIYLEYLESDGNQWIDTKFLGDNNTAIKATLTVKEKGFLWINCEAPATSTTNITLFRSDKNGGGSTRFGSSQYVFNPKTIDVKETYTQSQKGLYVDDVRLGGYQFQTFKATEPIRLLGNTTSWSGVAGKIYSCQIYDNGILARNFRPCLNPDTFKPALYDTVSKEYFYNQGTGEFKYELNFATLDCIESNGNQYIDTKYKPNDLTAYNIKTDVFLSSLGKNILGCRAGATESNIASFVNTNQIYVDFESGNKRLITPRLGNTNDIAQINISSNNIKSIIKNLRTGAEYEKTFVTTPFKSDINFGLFTTFGNPYPTSNAQMKIYFCEIYDNKILARDFIPVRKNDGIMCLYDFISGEYYYNKGTGKFKGYKNGYQIGDNIESTSTQYIDTKYKPNEKTNLEVGCSILDDNEYPAISNARNETIRGYYGTAILSKQENKGYRFLRANSLIDKKLTNGVLSDYHKYEMKGANTYVDDIFIATIPSEVAFQVNYNLPIFASNIAGRIGQFAKMKCNFYQLSENNEVLYLIPVKKGSFIGMLDVLTGEEYPNMGSGEFIFNE